MIILFNPYQTFLQALCPFIDRAWILVSGYSSTSYLFLSQKWKLNKKNRGMWFVWTVTICCCRCLPWIKLSLVDTVFFFVAWQEVASQKTLAVMTDYKLCFRFPPSWFYFPTDRYMISEPRNQEQDGFWSSEFVKGSVGFYRHYIPGKLDKKWRFGSRRNLGSIWEIHLFSMNRKFHIEKALKYIHFPLHDRFFFL